jgi:hypothetical protein
MHLHLSLLGLECSYHQHSILGVLKERDTKCKPKERGKCKARYIQLQMVEDLLLVNGQ